jgi:hypothetical protein
MVRNMATDPAAQVAQLEFVVREQMAHIAALQAKYDALLEAMTKEYGAHAALVAIYSDPTKPDSVRAKAAASALPFEKPKVAAPQQAPVFSLYDYLEAARLKKLKVIEGKAQDDSPAA